MKPISMDDIRALSITERIRLAEEIWDTIPATGEAVPISDAMREELDRRIEDHQIDPETGEPWETLKDQLRNRK